ncbi:MAG: hypothetical protein GX823_06735 [Clostridiales bacterium]|nr:hypothetical protein [Clostridiales bacterium]
MRRIYGGRTAAVFAAVLTAAALFSTFKGAQAQARLSRAEKTGGSISIAAPDYYETNDDGSIVYAKVPDPALISKMQAQGIKVTPFLSNHWNRAQARAMLERSGEAAAFLAASIRKYGLDGLDIDIQNINEDDRAAFVNFIRLLREAMPEGTSLTVCVAANPYGTDIGWQGGYDYAELAKYCDHIFMMTYDESYDGEARETSAPTACE